MILVFIVNYRNTETTSLIVRLEFITGNPRLSTKTELRISCKLCTSLIRYTWFYYLFHYFEQLLGDW